MTTLAAPARTRTAAVIRLLETLPDALEPLHRTGDTRSPRGEPDAPLTLNALYHAGCPRDCTPRTCRSPYRQLEHHLAAMRNGTPLTYLDHRHVERTTTLGVARWHTLHMWTYAEERIRWRPETRITNRGKRKVVRDANGQTKLIPYVVIVRHPHTDEQVARAGAAWIAGRWQGEADLPKELAA